MSFWSGKRVFLTGHTGFKGGWLALWLGRLGARVSGYSLAPPTQPSLFELARVAEGVASNVIADVRDLSTLTRELRAAKPEVVFHLAAQSLVHASYADPVQTYTTNVIGTVNVLEAARSTDSVRAVVVVTSDKCYENRESHSAYAEGDRLGGHDPYSNSKACAELVTQSYRDSFFSKKTLKNSASIATARAGNVIGGGDWAADRLLPDFVRAILEGKPVRIRRPDAVRPWQHVLDPLSGYLRLAERLALEGEPWAQAWNFGPDDAGAKTVRSVVERFAQLWGPQAKWQADREEHPHEAGLLRLDIGKAQRRLGWKPSWDLERSLEKTVAWYQAYAARADMRSVSLGQIEQFEAARASLERTA